MAEREFRKAFQLGGTASGSVVVVLPREFREALHIEPKTNLRLDLVDGMITIRNADLADAPKPEAKRK